MTPQQTASVKLTVSMLIFGSIGVFVHYIPIASSMIAMVRALLGVICLFSVALFRKNKLSFADIRKNITLLCISGAAIGFNWILLFESYRFTSVAVSTLCYYMAPLIVIALSPFILKEKLSAKKCLCLIAAIIGMVLISGIASESLPTTGEATGILLGIGAAVLYASVMLMNKHITGIPAFDKTVIQLSVAVLVLIPYNLLTVDWSSIDLSFSAVGHLIVVGVVHTGLAYYLYFGSMDHMSGQSIALFSYIDPVFAILASILLLQEPFTWLNGVGAVLIIGAAVIAEMPAAHRRKQI